MSQEYIIFLGRCEYQKLKTEIEQKIGVPIIEKISLDKIVEKRSKNSRCSCIIIGPDTTKNQTNTINIVQEIHHLYPYTPIILTVKKLPSDRFIDRVSAMGVVDFVSIDGGLNVRLLVNKLNVLNRMCANYYDLQDALQKQKLSHQKLHQNASSYINLLSATNTPYVYLNDYGEIIETNRRLATSLGFDQPEDLQGTKIKDKVCPKDKKTFDILWSNILKGDGPIEKELRLLNKNHNNVIHYNVKGALIRNGGNKIILLLNDISERKNKEATHRIEEQKKRDRLRQCVCKIKNQIDNINNKQKCREE